MAPQASKKCGLLPPDYKRIGSCMCNGINSYQVPGILSILRHIFHAQIDSTATYEACLNACKPQDRASVSIDSDPLQWLLPQTGLSPRIFHDLYTPIDSSVRTSVTGNKCQCGKGGM